MSLAIDFSTWAWPQWTYAGVLAFNVIANTFLNGTPKSPSNYSAGVALVASCISLFILASGGFFA